VTTMRAAQFHSYGPPEVITTGTAPIPEPAAGDVQVRVGATTVNGGELMFRAGRLRLLSRSRFPKGLGIDFAGQVSAIGADVHDVRVGDRVWGVLDSRKTTLRQSPVGAAADYLVVAASRVATLPDGVAYGDAVALLAGSTALTALRDKAHLRSGERLLLRGGTGGVGYVGLQLGHAFGAHVTTLVSARNIDTARQYGADVALDYRTTRPEDLGEFDVIFDTVGTRMNAYRQHLARGGRMVSITVVPPLRALATIIGSTVHGSRRIRIFSGNPDRHLLENYAGYIRNGDLRALIAGTYPLEDLAGAHRAAERGGGHGKRIITF